MILLLLLGANREADKVEISIKNLRYTPDSVTVQVGQKIVWKNDDDRDHTVTGEKFKSGNLSPGDTFEKTFDKPGKYAYGCRYHPRMKGTITVKE